MKITLALGGGAGLGWAHIGVIKTLQDANIEIAAVSGTSIGAIVAACFAADKLRQLEEIALSTNVRMMIKFIDPTISRGAFFGGRIVESELTKHLGEMTFADLHIPVSVIAADLITGDTVILDEGPLVAAVRASMSLPGVFKPVQIGDKLLVDGGAAIPVPVTPAKKLAPNVPCVAISLQNDYLNRARGAGIAKADGPLPGSISVIKASVGLSLANLAAYAIALDPPEILLNLPVGHIDIQNFTRAEELIEIGCAETRKALPDIIAAIAAMQQKPA